MPPQVVSEEEVLKGGEESRVVVASSFPHFVLVHGVGNGGWCWYKIRCLMESCGYKVSCIDLKSAGIDSSDPDSIMKFEDYNKPLIDFLSNLPDDEKVILVGHSAGGLSVTHALHVYGNTKIHLAIYVGATMLRLGFCTDEDVIDGVPDHSDFGNIYDLGFGLGANQPPTSVVMKKEFQRKIIYQMSPLEDYTLASMLLKPGPIQALQDAKFSEGKKVDEVQRIYIKTTNDRVVKPEQQNAMIKRWPPSHVFVVESDHSPFFSAPFTLFGLLVTAASPQRFEDGRM